MDLHTSEIPEGTHNEQMAPSMGVDRGQQHGAVEQAGAEGAGGPSEWTTYQLREGEFVIALDDSEPCEEDAEHRAD